MGGMMSKQVIEIRGLCKSYGTKEVLSDLELSVNSGEFISIQGKSGSGKSTLLNIIGLLETFTKGNYLFEGNDILKSGFMPRNKLRAEKLGFIFQSYYLLDNLSVEDNILMPLLYSNTRIDGKLKARLESYLKEFDLADLRDQKAKNLSGGEKQRTAIIRALIKDPDVIVADEPTGNLDPENADTIFKALRDLVTAGKTVIVVTHNNMTFDKVDKKYYLIGGKLHEKDVTIL